MKPSRLKRRTALKARKALTRGTARLKRGKRLKKRKRLRANEERRARLEARDYGPKGCWARTLPCEVTDAPAPSVAAHTKTRGSGGHSESIVPFALHVEIDWHALVEAKWEDKYMRSKDEVRERAAPYEAEWQRMLADGRAEPFIAQWEAENGRTWDRGAA